MTEKKCINIDKDGKYECDRGRGEEITCKTCMENFCNNSALRNRWTYTTLCNIFSLFTIIKSI